MMVAANRIPFVDLAGLHEGLREEIDAAIRSVVDSGVFILGPEVSAFEQEFAAYCEADHCVGVASGTAALQLSYEALGIGPGDEVIAPANTFVATVLPLLALGARPILVDVDPDTALIDVGAVQQAFSDRTRAIVAVHLYGQPADLDLLLELGEARGVPIVEDAAQAHGARYRGRRVGSLGRIGCFSFYPAKNLGALGDAGAVVTGDGELAERVRLLRDLGQERKYHHVISGHNARLDEVQAAVLRVKLRHLDGWNAARRAAADAYAEEFVGLPVTLPVAADDREHVWHLYVIRTPGRDSVRAALARAGIATGMHYPVPLHFQDVLAGLGNGEGSFPVTETWARELLSLPMFPGLDRDRVRMIASSLRSAVAGA